MAIPDEIQNGSGWLWMAFGVRPNWVG